MKTSQLERLRQLGDLREKGLLTEEEFDTEKTALMSSGDVSSRTPRGRGGARWAGRIALLVALGAAGAALYLALDARSQADESAKEAAVLRAKVAAFKPTLIVQSASSRTARIPDDGGRHNVNADCPTGATAVGGGFAIFRGSPEIIASYSTRPQWQVGVTSVGGPSSLYALGVCVRGTGGLKIIPRF